MRPSSLLSRLALAITLAASSLVACASPSDDTSSADEEVGSSEDAVRSRALGDVMAVRTKSTRDGVVSTTFMALPDKVRDMVEATGVKATRLVEGAPRCLPRNPPLVIEYLDAAGTRLGEATFACDAHEGAPPGPTPGTLRIAERSFIVSAYLDEVTAIISRPIVLGDSIYGISRVVGVHDGRTVDVTDRWDVKAAVESLGLEQEPIAPPQYLPSCVADNTVTLYRGAEKVATVNVLCTLDDRPAANAKLRLEGGQGGIILVDSENLRSALGLD